MIQNEEATGSVHKQAVVVLGLKFGSLHVFYILYRALAAYIEQ